MLGYAPILSFCHPSFLNGIKTANDSFFSLVVGCAEYKCGADGSIYLSLF